jgi:hypothetical protein
MTRQRVRRNHTPEQKINLLRRCVDMGDQERANVAEALVDGELFVAADAEGLVELAARLEGVGDLPQGDGPPAYATEALGYAEDAEGVVELAARLEDVGDLPRPRARSGAPGRVAERDPRSGAPRPETRGGAQRPARRGEARALSGVKEANDG